MSDETPKSVVREITPKTLLDALTGAAPSAPAKVRTRAQVKQEMEKQVEKIVDRRDLAKAKLLRVQEALKEEQSIHWLNLQLQTVKQCHETLEAAYLELCDVTPRAQREEHSNEYFQYEDVFNEVFVNIQTEIAKHKSAQEEAERRQLSALAPAYIPQQQPVVVANSTPHLKVPLPTFDGSLDNWYSFKCMFQTIMNRYPHESPAIKLYHLKNALIGSAAGKIDQDVINNNDYNAAWKMLEDTYEDERMIIDTHIDALLALPKMTSENGEELRKLIDNCTKHVDALKNRELPVEGLAESILVNVIAKRLDKETRKLWESQLPNDELPSYPDMMDYLRERSRILQKMKGYYDSKTTDTPKQRSKPETTSSQSKSFVQTEEVCFYCNGEHLIYKCSSFISLSVSDRYSKVKTADLCFNCLRRGHRTINCYSEKTCKSCHGKHHSLLHEEKSSTPKLAETKPDAAAKPEENKEVVVQAEGTVNSAQSFVLKQQVLLSTAEVLVRGTGNTNFPCRALLDSGSDSNLISEEFARKLNVGMKEINHQISGLNGAETHVKHSLRTKIVSRVNSFDALLDFLVVPTVTANLPIIKVDIQSWAIPKNLALADPSFHVPEEIHMIIGAELFFELLMNGRMKVAGGNPMLIETQLGWIVSGPVRAEKTGGQRSICQMNVTNEELNNTLAKFWELETVQQASPLTEAEQQIETHFAETFSRDETGRYIVRLPFKPNKGQLGDSMTAARNQFDRLLRSFINETKKIRYSEFMAEYLALGHMVEVFDTPNESYFLPHHAVYKESSTTTKIRIVFNGSAKTTSGHSLNDILGIGPTVQNDLVTVLLRFCSYPVALTADIPKMYRQVLVHDDDRKYQRILWLNSDGNPSTFELTTVTYGCASAPYLATRVLMQLAKDEGHDLPLASRVIEENSYVDDFLTGGNTESEVIQIYEELKEILRRGGFGVHKFCTNSETVRDSIPAELQEKLHNFEDAEINDVIKTLGLVWNPTADFFTFNVATPNSSVYTKRSVLSAIGQLFDPIGFLGPSITTAKLLMQDLWRLQLDWDDPLPDEQRELWTTFLEQLPMLNTLQKKRCVVTGNQSEVELHGFSDASQRAYGAVLYARSVASDGSVDVQLICSKSRVAPLTPTSIPRLELCGCLLLANLVKKVKASTKIAFKSVTLWVDSRGALSWLKKSPLALNQYVSNRVAASLKLTPDCRWRYIRSELNPADLISRGVLPADLMTMTMWWTGSPILWQPIAETDEGTVILDDNELPELKPTKVVTAAVESMQPIEFNRVSNYQRLQRAWAYVLRFIKNVRSKQRDVSELTPEEVANATMTIMKLVQQQAFPGLFKALVDGSEKRNEYSGLAPFIDEFGLIRVGGRLKYSTIPYEGRHQILLPKHHVTHILVRHLHVYHFHMGQRGLLSIVRQQFWPVNAKQLIKQIVSKCYVCFRYRPTPVTQFMGNLPDYRIRPTSAFTNTGVDYAGPIHLKEAGRKTTVFKGYIVVFVCMAVKAIHLELVSNLSSDNFIAALRRFISRRGVVLNIYSDNATTFTGANHELGALRQLFKDQTHLKNVNDFCVSKQIQWHFIPPRSPHFGGLWEAGVKSVKHHLKRVVGETKLTYEEMTTFLAQCEAVLNSRPLIPVSDDPNDCDALTPSHFLTGGPALSIPEPSYSEEKVGRLDRWQHIQLMKEHFWKRWSTEYLHTLQNRPKWNSGVTSIEVGALVVLKEDNIPPQQWPLGRIVATHPGEDDIVRVVSVKTGIGKIFKRAVTRICFLPSSVEPEDSTGGECCERE